MTAKVAATWGAFIGAAIIGGASAYVAARPAASPLDELRKDIAEVKSSQGEMKADLKVIKCRLGIEGICPK